MDISDEYALLIAFVTHAESGDVGYTLALDVEHIEKSNGVYRTCCAVYIDETQVFLVDMKDLGKHLISPSRLKPFGDNYLRQKHRKEFRLEDEPME